MTSSFIKWLKDIKKINSSTVGGKAANLGEMFSNFQVPDGFCITVSVFEKFLEDAKVKNKINSILKNTNANDLKKIQNISYEIKNLIIKSKIPKEIENEIIQNYKKLSGFVAVRSSAVAEDLEEASFAGQQATFLNVKGDRDLINSIKECWASFYGTRAIVYRNRNNFSQEPKMAVVVQKMVDAKKSGVSFTANPVTKSKDELIIEAVFGLGESIVSGIVTPDNYLIEKKSRKVISEKINEKKTAIFRKNGKNITLKLDNKKANEKAITYTELNEIIAESLKIERYYKKPMDIEWAIDDKVYILQARPITTL